MKPVDPLLAGPRRRCPKCGEAALFSGFLMVSPQCEACGEDLSKADSGDGPVVFTARGAEFIADGTPSAGLGFGVRLIERGERWVTAHVA